jgi:hypothetical protein
VPHRLLLCLLPLRNKASELRPLSSRITNACNLNWNPRQLFVGQEAAKQLLKE